MIASKGLESGLWPRKYPPNLFSSTLSDVTVFVVDNLALSDEYRK